SVGAEEKVDRDDRKTAAGGVLTAKQAPAGPAPPRRPVCAPTALSLLTVPQTAPERKGPMTLRSPVAVLRSAPPPPPPPPARPPAPPGPRGRPPGRAPPAARTAGGPLPALRRRGPPLERGPAAISDEPAAPRPPGPQPGARSRGHVRRRQRHRPVVRALLRP